MMDQRPNDDMDSPLDDSSIVRSLEAAGFVAADEEAAALRNSARNDTELRAMLSRRLTGEPLEWITGSATFCGLDVAIEPGVYVPRWQSEPLAMIAASLLPATGTAVDLGTGCGAIAMALQAARPDARIVATEIDPVAVMCARRNGLLVYEGNLDAPLPAALASQVDLMIGVLPYVPTDALPFLPRDVQRFEPRRALDGGDGGLELIAEVVGRSPYWVKHGGWLFLELGGDQAAEVTALFTISGYRDVAVLHDDDGDPRGIYGARRV